MDPGQKPGDALGTAPLLNEGKASQSPPVSVNQEQEPRSANSRTAEGKYRSYLLRSLYGPLKFVIIFGVIGALLAIPVIVIDADDIIAKAEIGDIDAFFAQQTRQVLYYIFGWLFISWIGLAGSFAIGTVLPYVFRFVARYFTPCIPPCPQKRDPLTLSPTRYVNPAHMRYWRVLRTLRRPISIAGLVSISYIGFAAVGLAAHLSLSKLLLTCFVVDLPEPRQPRHLIRQSSRRPHLD
jgi:hypothetical protein